jgi:hypothetical protein
VTASKERISVSRTSIRSRSDSRRISYASARRIWLRYSNPAGPHISDNAGTTPSFPNTACTWLFRPVRSRDSVLRYRTNSRNSRTDPGGIHDSGRLPTRRRSAKRGRIDQVVLHPPVLEPPDPQRMRQMHPAPRLRDDIRCPIPPPRGLQHHLRRRTSRQDQLGQRQGEFSKRFHHNRFPDPSRHTANERRRCRSIPKYAPTEGLLPLADKEQPRYCRGLRRAGEAPPAHRITSARG